MANQVNRQVNIFIASGEAEKAYQRLINKEKQLKDELAKATDPKIIARLKTELDKLQQPIDRAARMVRGELQPSFRDLQNTVNALGRRLRQLSTSDADYSRVLVQYQAANAALREQRRIIDQINDSSKRNGLNSFLGPLAANLASNALSKLKEIGSAALRSFLEVEGVRTAFDRLNQPGLLDNLRQATKGTVTDLELMKRAVAANNFQIPIERLGTLLSFAQRRARETGQSVDYLVDSIVTGIARKSPLILDNLGININRVNEQFKKTGDFAQAAFNVVDEEITKAGPALDTYADKIDRIRTNFSNMATDAVAGLVSIGENLSNYLVDRYGTPDMKADLQRSREQQAIAKENENARKQELSVIQFYQQEYARADKAGRDKILEQMRVEIKTIETQEAVAYFEGRNRLAQVLGIKLELWKKYFKDIGASIKDGDTIANLQKEIQIITEIRDNAIIGSQQFNDAQKKLKELQERLDKLLGRNQGQKRDDLTQKFREQLADMAKETDLFNAAQIDRDLLANQKKFDAVERQLKDALKKRQISEDDYLKFSIMNEDTRGRERTLIIQKWAEEAIKRRKELEKAADAERMKMLIAQQEAIAKILAEQADKSLRGVRYRQEVDLFIARGRDRLKARIAQLETERQVEIANAEKTNQAVADINRKYDQEIHNATLEFNKARLTEMLDFIQQMAGSIGQVAQLQTQREQQSIEDDRRANERKKVEYKRQLDGKQISQKEYDKKVQQLDKQVEEREKQYRIRQFNRDKTTALATAAVNIALAITKALGNPFQLAFVALMGAIQVATIAAQKPPKLAKGGRLEGPTHAEGGMPIINPRTGKMVAEIEGGEVVLSRNTVRNNAALVDQLLYTSVYRNGARLNIGWKQQQPTYLNTSAITASMHKVRMFENGGIMQPASTTEADRTAEVLAALSNTVNTLNVTLANGINAYTLLSEQERTQQRQDQIISDATLR